MSRLEELQNEYNKLDEKLKIFVNGNKKGKYSDIISKLQKQMADLENQMNILGSDNPKPKEESTVKADSYLEKLYGELETEMNRIGFFAKRGEIDQIGNLTMKKLQSLYERVILRESMYSKVHDIDGKTLRPTSLKGIDNLLSNNEEDLDAGEEE